MRRLDLQVTERARAWIADYLSRYEPGSVLALRYGSPKPLGARGGAMHESSARWRFVVLTRAQAEQVEGTSSLTGEGVYQTNDGTSLCISESRDLELLAGKMLDTANGTLAVCERAN